MYSLLQLFASASNRSARRRQRMTTTLTEQAIPTGTWTLDKVHSTVGYAVRHSGAVPVQGRPDGVRRVARRRRPPRLGRTSPASPCRTRTSRATCSRPTSSTPSSSRVSRSSRPRSPATATTVTVEGELEIRGAKQPVTLTGTIAGPALGERIGLYARDHDRPHRLRDELEHGAPERRQRARQRGQADRRPRAGEGVTNAGPRHQREPAARFAQPRAPARGGAGTCRPASSSSSSTG